MTNTAERRKDPRGKGIRLQTVNIIMIVVAGILAVLLLFFSYRITAGYNDMRVAMEEYIEAQQTATEMKTASDYLTEQVRGFAATGEKKYVDNYFEEVEVTRRRDHALDRMEQYLIGSDIHENLRLALERSRALESIELYAMRLTISSRGYRDSDYPWSVRSIALDETDLFLTALQRGEKAERILYDETYQSYKDQIRESVDKCSDALIEITRSRQVETSEQLLRLLRGEYMLIAALLLVVFTVALMTTFLIVRPLHRNVVQIKAHKMLPMTGSYEIRFLADTYNTIFLQNKAHRDQLSYKANHDDLTGLYNRGFFEKLRESCDPTSIAMLLVDVDHFKGFNDTFGHDVGDQVLRRVASALTGEFRAEDYVCRIGGDEFAVIMVHAGSDLRPQVEGKIQRINHILQNPEDDLPKVSLSVGVAFGDRKKATDDIFKDADTALYRVKDNGRNGCAFY